MILDGILDYLMAELPGVVPPGVRVFEGWPGEDFPPQAVILGPADMDDQWRTMGQTSTGQQNTTEVDVFITVTLPGKTQQDVRKRCVQISDSIETHLRQDFAHVSMNGLVTASTWSPREYRPGLSDSGRDGLLRCVLTALTLRK